MRSSGIVISLCINIFHIINILFLSLRLLTNFLMFFLLSMASKIREWNLVTRCTFALLLWLNGWSSYIWCVILVNDIMDLFMSSLGTLVPEGPCCVFYATRRQVRSDTSCGFLLVLWFNITHTRTHARTHTYKANRGLIDWHTQVNIYQHHLFCSHTSYPELYWMNNLLISKIYFLWFSKITRLWK